MTIITINTPIIINHFLFSSLSSYAISISVIAFPVLYLAESKLSSIFTINKP